MSEESSIKISVIIPAYQAERTLEPCVKSILEQTVDVFEIIIVDDGSTDGTYDIAIQLKKEDKRIVVIRQENRGAAAARNTGLHNMRGDYVAFIDSDDTVKGNYFEELICALPSDIVVTRLESKAYSHLFENNDGKMIYARETLARDFETLYSNYFFNSVCGKLYKKSIIGSRTFSEEMRVGEDLLFNLNVFTFAEIVVAITYVGYIYNPNVISTTHCFNSIDFDQQINICKNAYAFANSYLNIEGLIKAIDIVYLRNNIDLIVNLVTFEKSEAIKRYLHTYYRNSFFVDRCKQYNSADLNTDVKRRVFYTLIKNKNVKGLLLLGHVNNLRFKLKKK